MKMKSFIVFVAVCFLICSMLLGYSQFKTTSFKEMADEKNWAKTIIVEGYTYLVTDFVPVMVKDEVNLLVYDKVTQDSYIMLDFEQNNIKYMPLGKGIFKARIKGIVNLRDCEYDIIGLDVMWYGLALSEKIERKRM